MTVVNKVIWTYWHQGWDHAPSLVQLARRSWEKRNPDYEVRALDRHTLLDHVELPRGFDLERNDLTVQKISALGRLALLAKYGGVWTDATVVCTTPLREWLDPYYASGFFAFRSPGRDRLMSNWFIASDADSIILQRLYRDFSDFFANNYFENQNTPQGEELLKKYTPLWRADVKSTLAWHSPFALNVLRVYPYFIFHYTFNKLILTDKECAALWNSAKPFDAGAAHCLQNFPNHPNGIDHACRKLDSQVSPMYKLDWRYDTSSAYWSAVLNYLEELP